MVDRIRIISFGVVLIVALLLTLSAAELCDIKKDVCEYKFTVTYQLTMMHGNQPVKAANGKLYPAQAVNTSTVPPIPEDEVISMDGYSVPRLVVAINGMIPGPTIEAYIGQTVVVHVENQLYSSDVTIHWHGLHQKGTPFMDGVPYVTQCPIGASQSFTYRFNLTQTGTFWYHSHSGAQRTMGLYGALIIRDRKPITMKEHLMVLTEYNHIWDSNSIYLKISHNMFDLFDYHSCLVNGRGRFYEKPGINNEAPLAKFNVTQGQQYRFRVIAAGAFYAFEVSVDGHQMQIVSSDGEELEPQMADVVLIHPGERFDFIITANQTIGNYWIRGIFPDFTKNHTFEAILHYDGAADEEPISVPKNCSEDTYPCVVVNCGLYLSRPHRKCVLLSEMKSSFDYEVPRIEPGKWKEHFLNFAFPGPFGDIPGSVNGRRYKAASVNPLYQPNEVDTLCDNQNCGVDQLCTCTHSLKLNKDDTIQMVFLNMGSGHIFDHPVHMHGHTFSVVKMGNPAVDKKTGMPIDNPDIDCGGDPKKNFCTGAAWRNSSWGGDNIPGINFKRAPLKDTVIVPSGGYAVIRIKANNPGLWFMHCHSVLHSMDGMEMMLNESFADVPPAPKHFPVCRSFTSEAIRRIPEPKKDKQYVIMALASLGGVIVFLALCVVILTTKLVRRNGSPNISERTAFVNPGADDME